MEAVNWGMPAVNFERMRQAFEQIGGEPNQVAYWSRPFGWKNQTLTPNPDTIYFMPFYDTREGPVVLEIPPADGGVIVGSVDDAWQTAIADVGPAGLDKGRGGKYLILPPGYEDKVPAGYLPLPSSTYAGFAILRSDIGSGSEADIAKAVQYAKRIKLYPLAQAANPPPTKFVDALDQMFDATIPYDLRFYQSLNDFVQREPWLERDRAMIDMLKTIGIEKGKPFQSDEKTQADLEDAAREAHAWMDSIYEEFFPPFDKDARWALPASPEVVEGMSTNFAKPDSYPIDGRGRTYSYAYFSTKQLGAGQYYLMTIKDNAGNDLDGGSTYRLRVPADAPVRQYWSATVYDRTSHALIRDTPRSSRGSNSQGLHKNTDGSVDIWFGPRAPEGRESNWVPTKAGGQFEVMFRLYGPEQSFFEKRWVLPDLEKIP
ncbi:DUF1254 domain-containing protein [Microbulbifer pacificus]|uniref:DUF1254 domain-containing protein n=1 Tax=Microbulbifer pacificus TaxID=407164 RepID=UPI0018F898B5|nr:DUF1254 domain-containing protein [Microbulbifer pacificus]